MSLRVSYDAEALAAFQRRWGVTQIDVFGSVIRDDFSPEDSDVDLVLSFQDEGRVGLFDLCAMQRELEGVFDRHVDILTRQTLEKMQNPLRQRNIRNSLKRLDAA